MNERIESSWRTKKIGDLFRLNNRAWTPKSHSDIRVALYSLPSYDANKTCEFQNESSIESNKFLITQESLLIAKLNPRIVRVQVALPQQTQTVCSTEFMCYEAKSEEAYLPFFYYYCSSENFYKRLREIASGSTNSHVRVTPSETLEFQIRVPPLAEQKKIAEILSSVDEVIENTESEISKLEDLKKATLNELLTKGIGHTEFKDSEIGRIPKSWRVQSFEEIVASKMLGSLDRGGDGAQISLVKMGDLIDGMVSVPKESIAESKIEKQHLLEKNDFLFNTRNTPELVGKVANYMLPLRAAYDNNLLRVRFQKHVDSLFMGLLFNQSSTVLRLKRLVAGTTSVAAIYWGDLAKFKVVIPPSAEQKSISNSIEGIGLAISEKKRRLEAERRIKQGLMQDLLTGKVRVKVN